MYVNRYDSDTLWDYRKPVTSFPRAGDYDLNVNFNIIVRLRKINTKNSLSGRRREKYTLIIVIIVVFENTSKFPTSPFRSVIFRRTSYARTIFHDKTHITYPGPFEQGKGVRRNLS